MVVVVEGKEDDNSNNEIPLWTIMTTTVAGKVWTSTYPIFPTTPLPN